MEKLPLPNSIVVQKNDNKSGETIMVSPCYPGYGTTLGNALRRVLLSSLAGAAVTAVKIEGADHEFSTIENVREDMVEIILNLKQLRLRVHSDEPVELQMEAKGEGPVTAGVFGANSVVEIINPDLILATITAARGALNLKVIVQNGRGYVPVENRENEKLPLGYVAMDALFSPVKNVNFHTEHVRVAQMTNYDKLFMDIMTDQTMLPLDAFRSAAQILSDQFNYLASPEKEHEGAANEQNEETSETTLVDQENKTEEKPAEQAAEEEK